MERIKEAIERAADRREQASFGELDDVSRATQRVFHSLNKSANVIEHIEYPIRYNCTQVHQVDDSYLKKQRVLHSGTDEGILRAYKLLRTQIVKKMADKGWNSLAVMSARSGQGSSLTTVNLAISIAMEYRYTVLLADFNLRKPGIHRFFNFDPVLGLSDYFLHGSSINEMLFNPGVESLVVLPGREEIDDSAERLVSPASIRLVDEIKARYPSRIVLFDLPPLLESDDAIAFLDHF
ncbi:MAG: CpsD/CapB family tyrosine-protein kinase, partial [Pseudomonadales bacterium]|nr:CpsD/CapB family tyrosine-protein kinase [Pseudomonadales bacterium]